MSKIVKLKTLTLDELWKLYENNKEWGACLYEDVAQVMSEESAILYNNIFNAGDNPHLASAVEVCNNYNSYFLSLRKPEWLLDLIERDELPTVCTKDYEQASKAWEEYHKLEQEEGVDDDELDAVWSRYNGTAERLLKVIEDYLHDVERVDDDAIQAQLELIRDGIHYMSSWETDGVTVYEHKIINYK